MRRNTQTEIVSRRMPCSAPSRERIRSIDEVGPIHKNGALTVGFISSVSISLPSCITSNAFCVNQRLKHSLCSSQHMFDLCQKEIPTHLLLFNSRLSFNFFGPTISISIGGFETRPRRVTLSDDKLETCTHTQQVSGKRFVFRVFVGHLCYTVMQFAATFLGSKKMNDCLGNDRIPVWIDWNGWKTADALERRNRGRRPLL